MTEAASPDRSKLTSAFVSWKSPWACNVANCSSRLTQPLFAAAQAINELHCLQCASEHVFPHFLEMLPSHLNSHAEQGAGMLRREEQQALKQMFFICTDVGPFNWSNQSTEKPSRVKSQQLTRLSARPAPLGSRALAIISQELMTAHAWLVGTPGKLIFRFI